MLAALPKGPEILRSAGVSGPFMMTYPKDDRPAKLKEEAACVHGLADSLLQVRCGKRPWDHCYCWGGLMGLCIAGRIIDHPMAIWQGYTWNYPRTIRNYDLAASGDPNYLTADEAWRSRIINSRLTRSECQELVSRAAEPDCPWGDISKVTSLSDADPTVEGETFDKAARLYWHFMLPERIYGIRAAKVHKILHIKRPGLYPILDERVKDLYRDSVEPWVRELGRLGVSIEDSPPYWAAIRDDLVRNETQLDAYRHQLAADHDKSVALMGQLTNLRLQDIIAWQVAG